MAVAVNEKPSGEHILVSPIWLLCVRGAQFAFSVICLALAANIMSTSLYLDEFGLNVAVAVITWFALAYIVLSEVVPALQITYHIIAVLVLEGLLVILWLATFASTAAARAAFVDVSVPSSCFGTFCVRKRAILYGPELDKFSATAGIGALVWLLFIASCVWTYVMFFKARKEGHFQVLAAASTHTAGANNYQLESKLEAPAPVSTVDQTQMPAQYAQPTYGQQPYTAPVQGTYPPQEQSYNQYPPQQYPPQQYAHEGAGDYQNMPPHGQPIPSASPPPHQS